MHGTIGGEEDGVGIQFDAVMWKDAWLCCGDNRDVLPYLPRNSVDAIVTDPPYALNFMGKFWDNGDVACDPAFWAHCWRVLKPGGHLAAFGGSRSYHRMASAIEDAGFEIRDSLMWVYGSGFPKSHDVSKGIDKAAGIPEQGCAFKEMLAVAVTKSGKTRKQIDAECGFTMRYDTAYNKDPIGWGCTFPGPSQWSVIKTVLPIPSDWDLFIAGVEREVIARQARKNAPSGIVSAGRPSIDFERDITVPATDAAREWQGWGTALKPAFEPIVLARKPLSEGTVAANVLRWGTGALNIDGCRIDGDLEQRIRHNSARNGATSINMTIESVSLPPASGRWPANVCHDGSDEVVGMFPATKSGGQVRGNETVGNKIYGKFTPGITNESSYQDSGSAARFFYSAKASKTDRAGSKHPTVKPIALMRWLARLITPQGGTILDPFAGSGTTGAAALAEGMKCILIEREPEYQIDIRRRLDGDC